MKESDDLVGYAFVLVDGKISLNYLSMRYMYK